jgi:hypothetical protein
VVAGVFFVCWEDTVVHLPLLLNNRAIAAPTSLCQGFVAVYFMLGAACCVT